MDQAVFQHRNDLLEAKHCWVCFANEDDDYSEQWVSPCKCRGTAKWVHKACLQRWIDEKQQGNSSVEVSCPQCNSIYIILYPKSGILVNALDMIDRIICKSCPFLAGGILVGSVYWTAVTYGAVTIMQVLGHKEGLNVMEKADPLIMLIGLPAIPVMLMLGRLIRWEDAVLKFWRKHSTKLPLLNIIFPNSGSQYLPRTPAVAYSSNSDPVSFTRTICGGLILPTIATIVGKLLFQRGGIAFIGLKGIFKIYYKQQQFLRQAHRLIKNYESNSLMASVTSNSLITPTTSTSLSTQHPTRTTNSTQTTQASASTSIQSDRNSAIMTATTLTTSNPLTRQTSLNQMINFNNDEVNQPAQSTLYSVAPFAESSVTPSLSQTSSNLTFETSSLNDYLLYEANLNSNNDGNLTSDSSIESQVTTTDEFSNQALFSNFSNSTNNEF